MTRWYVKVAHTFWAHHS